jgi:hypothetical protein
VLLVPVHTHTGIRPTADGMYSLLGGLGFFVLPQMLIQPQRTISRRFGITLHWNSVCFLNWMLVRDVEVVYSFGSY